MGREDLTLGRAWVGEVYPVLRCEGWRGLALPAPGLEELVPKLGASVTGCRPTKSPIGTFGCGVVVGCTQGGTLPSHSRGARAISNPHECLAGGAPSALRGARPVAVL